MKRVVPLLLLLAAPFAFAFDVGMRLMLGLIEHAAAI